jgi:hypothetical protein
MHIKASCYIYAVTSRTTLIRHEKRAKKVKKSWLATDCMDFSDEAVSKLEVLKQPHLVTEKHL